MPEPRPVREGREKADAVRFEYGLGRAPIHDLFGFIERNHRELLVVVRPMADGPDGALLRASKRWLIVVNSDDQELARQRFAAGHELGYYLFDRDSSPVHIDGDLFSGEAPAETRANSFAVHLLLPASVIRERIGNRSFNPSTPQDILSLAIEYGLDLPTLGWHLKNILGLNDAERRRIADIPAPHRLANQLGLTERIRQERAARRRTSWPQRYLALASQAFERGKLNQEELVEFFDQDRELAQEIASIST